MTIEAFSKKINWLGHDGFRIDTEKTIYFDPFQIEGGPRADLILITHDHFDHCSPEDVEKIQDSQTVIVTEKDCAKKLSGDVRVLQPGESLSVDDIKIQAVHSYTTQIRTFTLGHITGWALSLRLKGSQRIMLEILISSRR